MKRRQFLRNAVLAMAVAPLGACTAVGSDRELTAAQRDLVDRLADLIPVQARPVAARWGPPSEIGGLRDLAEAMQRRLQDVDLTEAYTAAVRADFRSGDVVAVDGWQLARTEVLATTAVALRRASS